MVNGLDANCEVPWCPATLEHTDHTRPFPGWSRLWGSPMSSPVSLRTLCHISSLAFVTLIIPVRLRSAYTISFFFLKGELRYCPLVQLTMQKSFRHGVK
jgi:hypothetical protein